MKPRGRPLTYDANKARLICEGLADGKSLRDICEGDGMPTEATVRAWALDDIQGFNAQYARARSLGYDMLAEDILRIADTPLKGVKTVNKATGVEITEADMIEHRRLQVDTRKWMLSKMLPKRYGDKVEATLQGPNGGPIETSSTITLTAEEAYKRMLGGE
jgi:hypothetical protein